MANEIERKFLVKGNQWRNQSSGVLYRQGYLSTHINRTVRIRVVGKKGFITIKSLVRGSLRTEYEYEIPFKDAAFMLSELCKHPIIEKNRYKIKYEGHVWEVDEFFGENEGLIVAEVELSHENQSIDLPDWIGLEVTDDPRYLNANLVKVPYKNWK